MPDQREKYVQLQEAINRHKGEPGALNARCFRRHRIFLAMYLWTCRNKSQTGWILRLAKCMVLQRSIPSFPWSLRAECGGRVPGYGLLRKGFPEGAGES